jgi:hypothetical protein
MPKKLKKQTLCNLTAKSVKGHFEEYVELVSKPRFFCQKCLRVSAKKRNLCRPERLITK